MCHGVLAITIYAVVTIDTIHESNREYNGIQDTLRNCLMLAVQIVCFNVGRNGRLPSVSIAQ